MNQRQTAVRPPLLLADRNSYKPSSRSLLRPCMSLRKALHLAWLVNHHADGERTFSCIFLLFAPVNYESCVPRPPISEIRGSEMRAPCHHARSVNVAGCCVLCGCLPGILIWRLNRDSRESPFVCTGRFYVQSMGSCPLLYTSHSCSSTRLFDNEQPIAPQSHRRDYNNTAFLFEGTISFICALLKICPGSIMLQWPMRSWHR